MHPGGGEHVRRPNARELEQLRRGEASQREDDLPIGVVVDGLATVTDLDADRPVAGEQHPHRDRVDRHRQVLALLGRAQEGVGGADSAPVFDVCHAEADALVVGLVVVVDALHTERACSVDEFLTEGVTAFGDRRDRQRPTGASSRGGTQLVVLDLLVRLDDVRPSPTRIAERLEGVPVRLCPTVVDHAVDGAGPTQGLAPHPDLHPVVGPERFGLERPDVLRLREGLGEPLRDANHHVLVPAPRLDQENPVGGIP